MTPPIKVLIVDDHPIVRNGLAAMIANREDMTLIGQAENGEQALNILADTPVDVVLMDLRMPVLDGVAATQRIRAAYPATHVLILTTYDADRDIWSALDAGAIGYLLKGAPLSELVHAIHAAARGESIIDASVAERVEQRPDPSQQVSLTDRERDVLQGVAAGHSNKEIAKTLYISASTVKTHLLHIYEKLGVSDRTAAVMQALSLGLIVVD